MNVLSSRHSPPAARRLQASKPGFTLVELLVVIAIIGILVALLLPAVQAARAAARAVACKSNIRNIGLACLNYESTHRSLPMGFPRQARRDESWGWSTYILPFLEEQALYDSLGASERRLMDLFLAAGGNPDAPEIRLVQTPLGIYRCPSDSTPPLVPCCDYQSRHFQGNHTPPNFEPATANYVGVKGFFDQRCDGPRCANNGTMFGNSGVRLQEIEDGTSKTFMVGERGFLGKVATWIGVRNPPGSGMYGCHWVIGRISIRLNFPLTGSHNTRTEGFGSDHVGGAHFAFVDGSVHFINESIDFNNGGLPLATDEEIPMLGLGVYQRLGIRNDGQPIPGDY